MKVIIPEVTIVVHQLLKDRLYYIPRYPGSFFHDTIVFQSEMSNHVFLLGKKVANNLF